MKNIIEMNNITKAYQMGQNKLVVLKGIDLTITEGDFIAILGPSGSGKSTMMNIIGCIDTKSSGEFLLDGKNIENFSENELSRIRNEKIGFVFQKFNLLGRLSTLRNVEIPLLLRGNTHKEAKVKASEYLEMVGLGDRIHHKPIELSGGQQQRVAIARALIGEPQLLLADEPTGNLDQESGKEIMALFKSLNEAGNTIIMITHDEHVASIAKKIIHVLDGKIVDVVET